MVIVLLVGTLRADDSPCPQIVFHTDVDLDLSKMEKRLACGDPENPAWKHVPPYQARLFLEGFLQSRGFLRPEFKVKEDVLNVFPGSRSRIKKINVHTGETKENKHVKAEVQRQFRKRVLTPKVLNAIEADGLSVLRRRGFPCATVTSEAFVDKNSVDLTFEKLHHHPFGLVEKEEIKGLHKNALERFYPFESEDPFDELLLELTKKRMRRSEVVSGTYFLEKCSDDGKEFNLNEYFILGPPTTVRFGIGANTESGLLTHIRWAHNRYKHMASQLSANLMASFKIQTLSLSADQFLWPEAPRRSLFSRFEMTRESQFSYLQTLVRLRPHMKWTRDELRRFWSFTLGPSLEAGTFKSQESSVTSSYKNVALEAGVGWMSHPYEYYEIHPEEGDTFGFNIDYRDPRLGFDSPLLKLDSTLAKLVKVGVWERGNVVGAARLMGGSTFVPAESALNDLPPSLKFYGGGSDDIRGFQLRTLPRNDGLGALSKVAMKLELRRTYFFREDLEAFAFFDAARFGEEPWILERRVWWSPGVGLRWLSSIGMVQVFAAQGRATHPDEDFGNLYFIGMGGTF